MIFYGYVVCVYFKVSQSKNFSDVSLSDVLLHQGLSQNRQFHAENRNIYIHFSSLLVASKACAHRTSSNVQ